MRFIQRKFVNSKKARAVEDISKVFAKLVLQGKLSAAIKLLENESSSGLLDLSPEVLEGLKLKISTRKRLSPLRACCTALLNIFRQAFLT